jgi:uncharacterized protein YdeI (BOF family)
MKKSTQSLLTLGTLALALGTAPLYAQQDSQSSSTPPSQQQQQPDQSQQQQPPAGNDAQGQQSASDVQTFSGTIVKQGDRYALQDASSGKTYDIDKQDGLKQYEGKQVRVRGTLDADGKTIHMK